MLFASHFKKRFLTGILVILPLFITVMVLRFLVNMLTGLMTPALQHIFPHFPIWLKMLISIAILVVLIYLLGVAAGHFLGHWFLARMEELLMRSIYGSSREFVRIFLNPDQKSSFKEVVLVEFLGQGLFAFGFITGSIVHPNGMLCYKVFIPTTPNPTTGFLEVIEQSRAMRCGLTVEEGIKMIMSGGLLGPESLSPPFSAAASQVEPAVSTVKNEESMKGNLE